jgi:hypothetical protein
MKKCMLAAGLGLAVSGAADAAFTGYSVTATNVTDSGQNLVRYEVFATFNGPTDTVLNVFNLCATAAAPGEDAYGGFWHKDNSDYNGCVLSPVRNLGAATERQRDDVSTLRFVPHHRRHSQRDQHLQLRPLMELRRDGNPCRR